MKSKSISKIESPTLLSQLKEIRHYLHQHPELSDQEFKTTEFITNFLEQLGYKIITPTSLKTGVIAEIGPNEAPNVIALRSDIDALPIDEQTDLNFASENAGVMHACGHDFHMASLMGAAVLLADNQSKLTSKIRLVFQPAEETNAGAREVIESGVLNDVAAIIGFHNEPTLAAGEISVSGGVQDAAVDQFKVTLKGIGGHAAHPNQDVDPIVGLASTITSLQTIVSRNIDPIQPSVLSVTHIESGSTWNAIPDEAWFEGTLRTFSDADAKMGKEKFYQIVQGQATTYGLDVNIEWIEGPRVLKNDDELAKVLADDAQHYAKLVNVPPTPGGEDFAFYTDKLPSVFAEVGSGANVGLHHSNLVVDDDGLMMGVKWFYHSALRLQDYLEEGEQ